MMALQDHWLWLIAAAVLGIAELVVPGVYLIWIGLAALITGLAALLLPLPVAAQFGLFAVTAFAAVYAGRRYLKENPIVSDDPKLNDRSARLVGSIVTAVEAVDSAHGRVKVGDSVWSARGADAAVGDRLRVTGSDGNVLLVEKT
jgi:membrane protein implicated in regulation of membrane protease activity